MLWGPLLTPRRSHLKLNAAPADGGRLFTKFGGRYAHSGRDGRYSTFSVENPLAKDG